jgi:hypothetical protein
MNSPRFVLILLTVVLTLLPAGVFADHDLT